MSREKFIHAVVAAFLGVGVFLFWWLWHPEALSYQEQNQLFLWTGDYLWSRLSVAGGVADWLGEFIVQFFCVEWLGALMMAGLFLLMQKGGRMIFAHTERTPLSPPKGGNPPRSPRRGEEEPTRSINPPRSPRRGEEEPALGTAVGVKNPSPSGRLGGVFGGVFGVIFPLFFLWLMGDENVLVALPVAVTLVLAAIVLLRRTRWWWWLPIVAALYWSVGTSWTTYYRIPQHGPDLSGWDSEKWELLKQDYLIRHERWDELLERAKKHEVKTAFWSNSVNLALAMTGRLADSQFDYWQSGEDALLMPMVRDNVSNLPTAEAFWRLGMVNSALRYMSDIQESILNARKSGRCEQRIVECMLVNGKYDLARKHLSLLKKSFFYRSWAEEAERFANGEKSGALAAAIDKARRLRYKENFLYSYPEIDKMLGILFQENPQNKMALEYFLGQLLLKGNAQTFMQSLPMAQQHGGYTVMPLAWQDAVGCMQSRSVPDTPYGKYIKRKMGGQQR